PLPIAGQSTLTKCCNCAVVKLLVRENKHARPIRPPRAFPAAETASVGGPKAAVHLTRCQSGELGQIAAAQAAFGVDQQPQEITLYLAAEQQLIQLAFGRLFDALSRRRRTQ